MHDHDALTGHAPGSAAAPSARRIRRMALALAVIATFFVAEVVVAVAIDSLALLADAGHMATDLLGLAMGLSALALAKRGSSNAARTFGWHRAEVLTALVNAVLLLGVAGFVAVEAVARIGQPPDVPGGAMIAMALVGLGANVVAMFLLRDDKAGSLAVRGAYLEVLADAVGSVGVLAAGAATLAGFRYADLVVGVAIAVWVLPRALRLAGASLRILTQASPSGIDVPRLDAELHAIDGVSGVHDLHVWTLTTGMDVVSVHLSATGNSDAVLAQAQTVLGRHGLGHATVQVESPGHGRHCAQETTW